MCCVAMENGPLTSIIFRLKMWISGLQIVELPEGTGRGSLFTWQMADSLGINFAQVIMSEWIQKSLDCFFLGLNFVLGRFMIL